MSRFAGINQSEVDYGAIAQLGERLPCTQEVGGSIPPGSTTFPQYLRLSGTLPPDEILKYIRHPEVGLRADTPTEA